MIKRNQVYTPHSKNPNQTTQRTLTYTAKLNATLNNFTTIKIGTGKETDIKGAEKTANGDLSRLESLNLPEGAEEF